MRCTKTSGTATTLHAQELVVMLTLGTSSMPGSSPAEQQHGGHTRQTHSSVTHTEQPESSYKESQQLHGYMDHKEKHARLKRSTQMDLETLGLPTGQVKAKSSCKGWGGETSWGRYSRRGMDAEECAVAKSWAQAVFRRTWVTARGRTAGIQPGSLCRSSAQPFLPAPACTLLPWLESQQQCQQWDICLPPSLFGAGIEAELGLT